MDNLIFKEKAFKHIKRVIGFIDNDITSPTFGCADRNYWHYKIIDYYNARHQETCLVLAFFYLDKDGFLYKNEKMLNLIRGVIEFWLKNLNKNGSVNEVYPYEQSFCATSFTAYIITETIFLLNLKEIKEIYRDKLSKVGLWLTNTGNWHISNQIAASAMALYNLGIMLSDDNFVKESFKRVDFLIENLKKNGFFEEYGGFDLGYNTLTMSILARFYQKTSYAGIIKILEQLNGVINSRLDKYAMYDKIDMSRNTEFIYPFSFKLTGSGILKKIRDGLEKDLILNPDWLDDRYLTGLVNDYLMTYYIN